MLNAINNLSENIKVMSKEMKEMSKNMNQLGSKFSEIQQDLTKLKKKFGSDRSEGKKSDLMSLRSFFND